VTRDAEERGAALDRLEEALGYRFENRALLENSLHHSSYSHERAAEKETGIENNERLEFLGDAVLAVVVAHSLYAAKPDWREGDLTRALHALVEGRSLEKLARSFEVGPAILLGRTERQSGGQEKPSILENAMEAIVGAIYLDGGLGAVTAFVGRAFGEALAADAPPVRRDPKTEFQERVMAQVGEFPSYHVVQDSLVEGDENRFTLEVCVEGRPLARGVGRTKRAGERQAAETALVGWRAEHPEEG
jgi:ribonuclease-3